MSPADKANLNAERDAIKQRLEKAPDASAKTHVTQNFGERLAHLEARLSEGAAPPSPETPAPPASK